SAVHFSADTVAPVSVPGWRKTPDRNPALRNIPKQAEPGSVPESQGRPSKKQPKWNITQNPAGKYGDSLLCACSRI
ncbi:hypothetical protein, partial [Pontiella sp.]|uniref:hypothetical protein n=1 Tax=Pontiella sp. TaxID=2837462 RepID=UPI003567172D